MKTSQKLSRNISYLLFLTALFLTSVLNGQTLARQTDLDIKVEAFLKSKTGQWRDMNIPASDGQLMYDIILENGYSSGLEIGTSTGHSAIWIAWAFSKTGGKLITLEIDEQRYKEAIANFAEAGLSNYIDARLANAHDLVKELPGPFDFVFSDADKDWYTKYFKDVSPKLIPGGCFIAHNVRPAGQGRRGMRGTSEYLNYVSGLKEYSTTVDNTGGGMAISYKKE
ncbi:MAG: methyltransferase [Flavobacteriaceae bacterium]|nr:class I SAM-dependent methyltransferase [Eudoraea sp.]NNJ38681.1 methyltransferase [Flavobacteriaceae bacterium]